MDGNYTNWSEWTSCSTTCGVGIKMRNRTCTSPTPQFGGKSCEEQGLGLAKEAAHCYLRQCAGAWNRNWFNRFQDWFDSKCIVIFSAVNGKYSNWEAWQPCSQTCGPGYRIRSRSCTNPPPANSGQDCSRLGRPVQSSQCYVADCPGE